MRERCLSKNEVFVAKILDIVVRESAMALLYRAIKPRGGTEKRCDADRPLDRVARCKVASQWTCVDKI